MHRTHFYSFILVIYTQSIDVRMLECCPVGHSSRTAKACQCIDNLFLLLEESIILMIQVMLYLF